MQENKQPTTPKPRELPPPPPTVRRGLHFTDSEVGTLIDYLHYHNHDGQHDELLAKIRGYRGTV